MLIPKGIISGLPKIPKGFFKGGLSLGGVKIQPKPPPPPPAGPCGAYDETKGMTDWPTAPNPDVLEITNKGVGSIVPGILWADVKLKQPFGQVKSDSSSLWKGILHEDKMLKDFKYYMITGWSQAYGCKVFYTNELKLVKSMDLYLQGKPHDPPPPPPIIFKTTNQEYRQIFTNKDVEYSLKKLDSKFTLRGLHMLLEFKTMCDTQKFNSRTLHTARGKVWLGRYSGVFDRYQNGTNSWTALWWSFKNGGTDMSWKQLMARSSDTKDMFDYQWNWFQAKRGTKWTDQGLSSYDCMNDPWYWPDDSENDYARRGRGSGSASIHPRRDDYFEHILSLWEKDGLGWKYLKNDALLKKIFTVENDKIIFQGHANQNAAGVFDGLSFGFCSSLGSAGSVTGLKPAGQPTATQVPSTISGDTSSGGTNKTMSRTY